MRPIRFTFGPLPAAAANNIATSQTPAGVGNLTLNGTLATAGVVTMDATRHVAITSAGDDHTVTFTVYGANRYGQAISEAIAGASAAPGTSTTVNDFATVTRIAVSGATASTVTVGTSATASIWVPLNTYANPPNASMNVIVTGTINFTVNSTTDDAFPASGIVPANWVAISALSAKSATTQGTLTTPATAVQLVINSGSGSVQFELVQASFAY